MTKKNCSFAIIKNIGKERHLITDGDEIYDTDNEEKAAKLVSVLNQNTDSGCIYELVSIPKRKK
jgi:hypothetical protein